MKTQRLALAACVAVSASFITALVACATDATVISEDPPAPDAGSDTAMQDGDVDAEGGNADASPCTDCAYFPPACTPDSLCLNGPFDSTSQTGLDWRTQINAIRGRSASDVWAAGALGTLAHFDGTSWTLSDPGINVTMRALWLRDSADVAFGLLFDDVYTRGMPAQDGGAAVSDGGWTRRAATRPPDYDPTSMTFASTWAAPGAEWLWSAAVAAFPQTSGLWRMHVTPSNELEIGSVVPADVGVQVLPCSQMTSIHGASASELWAVGLLGKTFHVSDAASAAPRIEEVDSQTWSALNGVWSASDSEAWAVGASGTIRHYTGQSRWEIVAQDATNESLNAVWGASPSDIWAVGERGVVLHYDGKSWSRVKIAGLGDRRPKLTTVWMPAPGHVWIGGQGVVLSLGGKP